MTAPKRCRRCLLEDMADEQSLLALIREQITLLPPEARAAADRYQERLTVCRGCPWLQGGMCGLCGCYVELRAAKGRMECPDVPPRWR